MPLQYIRSKAPLRIGLAGGGTDVSPYSDLYGGAILNATINLYAYTTIEVTEDNTLVFQSIDQNQYFETPSSPFLEIDTNQILLKGAYNHIIKNFNNNQPLSCKITTFVDAPAGSGLGTSSTLMVSIIGAFVEWLKLPLGEYDIAHLAYEIERTELKMAGGKQDQYAATFGGFNFMEFHADNKVIVNPLRIKQNYINELDLNILLYYTSTSRQSATIIEAQQKNVKSEDSSSIEATHKVKEQAFMMKEAILKGELNKVGQLLDFGWQNKKKMASNISNASIDAFYELAMQAGANGGKISGAGGGGFMTFYCPNNTRFAVEKALLANGGEVKKFQFCPEGLTTWSW